MKKNENCAPPDMNKKDERYTEEYYFKLLNERRYILLYDEINQMSADVVCSKIIGMNMLDKKKSITIEINSPGGDIHAGIAIINCIEQSKAPIITVINGQACSMAAIISIVGDKRKMYYNSFWMNHPLSEGQADYLQYIKDRVAFLVQLENTMTKILTKYTKLNKIDLHRCEAGELWLNAQDALKKGIIDEIIE